MDANAATYAELEALDPNLIGEIIAGELVASPRPAPRHAQASSHLGGLLAAPFRFSKGGPGGWRMLDTRRRDRVQKLPIYARERVGHVWLVEPDARTLEAYRLDGEGWHRLGAWADADKVRAAPFEAVELDLSLLWG